MRDVRKTTVTPAQCFQDIYPDQDNPHAIWPELEIQRTANQRRKFAPLKARRNRKIELKRD
jgi:hypothetical protein